MKRVKTNALELLFIVAATAAFTSCSNNSQDETFSKQLDLENLL